MLSLLFPHAGAGPRRQLFSRVLLAVLAFTGVLTLGRQVAALSPPAVYEKDFTQEYLLARAVLDRANPYVPQPELAAGYFPAAIALPQVTPHPPLVAVVAAPLGLLPYQAAAGAWLVIELVLLLGLVMLLTPGDRSLAWWGQIGTAFCILLLWLPVAQELDWGQLNFTLAVLLLGCWLAFARGSERLSAALLGIAIALKLFPALLLGYFLLRKRWLIVTWASAIAIALFAVSGFVIGSDGLGAYLTSLPDRASFWRSAEGNYSLVATVWRVFAGSVSIQPLVPLAGLALPLSFLAGLAVLIVAGQALRESKNLEPEWGLIVAAMLLVGPVTWVHYFVLLISPLVFLGRRLHEAGWPRKRTNRYLLAIVVIGIPVGGLALQAAAAMGESFPVRAPGELLPGIVQLPLVILVLLPSVAFGLFLAELRSRYPADGVTDEIPVSRRR